MSFEARTDRLGTMTVVVLAGELDIASEAAADGSARPTRSATAACSSPTCASSTFLDSTGVRVLLTADLHAKKRGVRFGVARSDGMVRRLLEVTRIEQRFPVVDDPAELTRESPAACSVAEAGEALGLCLALGLALGAALLVAGLLVLLVVLEADDADLAAQRAVTAERGELLAAGRAIVARPTTATPSLRRPPPRRGDPRAAARRRP